MLLTLQFHSGNNLEYQTYVCLKNFKFIQLLKESDLCSTFALFYQNQFV